MGTSLQVGLGEQLLEVLPEESHAIAARVWAAFDADALQRRLIVALDGLQVRLICFLSQHARYQPRLLSSWHWLICSAAFDRGGLPCVCSMTGPKDQTDCC